MIVDMAMKGKDQGGCCGGDWIQYEIKAGDPRGSPHLRLHSWCSPDVPCPFCASTCMCKIMV
jgi:hypothetical protein